MPDPIKSKIKTDIVSSRMNSQSSTSRSILRIGSPAIYITPKQIIAQPFNSQPQDADINSQAQINRSNSLNAIQYDFNAQQVQNLTDNKNIGYLRYKSKLLMITENIIFLLFFMGSFIQPHQLRYFDMAGNIIAASKILVIHIFLFILNNKIFKKKNQKQQEQQSNHQKQQQQQKHINYINRLQKHQLFQLWSIAISILIPIFVSYQIIFTILNCLRAIRLFYPFYIDNSSQNKWRLSLFAQVIKLTLWVFVIGFVLAISMQLLLYNIDNYYCLTNEELNNITLGSYGENKLISCGVMSANRCSSQQLCRNVYSYVQNQQHKQKIRQWVKGINGGFSNGIVNSLMAVMGVSGGMYSIYKQAMIQVILLPIFLFLWFIFLIITGIGMGQAMRGQSVQNWKRNIYKYTKNKSLKFQNSNFSFPHLQNPTKYVPQISYQLNQIQKSLSSRSACQKLCTIFFNIISILQLLFIICNNLNLDQISTRNTGILLGVIFILWSFGLGLAIFQYVKNPDKQQNSDNKNAQSGGEGQQNRKLQGYILTFQLLAYLLVLFDYLVRIWYKQLLFQSQTQITAFSQAILSFRVMYILFNNGFDAEISYYIQKIIQNFSNCSPVIGNVAMTGIVIGFSWTYIRGINDIGKQIENAAISVGFIFGNGLKFVGDQIYMQIIKIMVIFASWMACFHTKNAVLGYEQVFNIDFSQIQMDISSQVQNEQEGQHKQQNNTIKQFVKKIIQNEYYNNFKSLIIIVYVVISLFYVNYIQSDASNIFKFCVDIFLLIDTVAKAITTGFCGSNSYLKHDIVPKLLFIVSQIYLIISFFDPYLISHPVTAFLHVSRCLLLFSYQQFLNNIYNLAKNVLFHPKLKIYKLFIIGFTYLIMCASLISLYISRQQSQQQKLSITQKIKNLVIACTSFVYFLQWKFINQLHEKTLNYQIQNISQFAFNLIFIIGVVFLNGCIFLVMITYFVNRQVKNQGSVQEIISKQFSQLQPNVYNYQPVLNQFYYGYLKCVKIVIILVSIVLLCLLSGDLLEFSKWRNYVAIANLSLCLIQILIYFIQGAFVKKRQLSKKQGILLLLSLPGSFFLVFPIIKFSIWLQLSVVIRIFFYFSMLRILRIFPLIINRQFSQFSSKMLRRIQKQLYIKQITLLFGFLLFLILPLAVYQSNSFNTSISKQFINILTGGLFPNNNIGLLQLLIKIFYAGFVIYPLKLMILSRAISGFLDNRGQIITVVKDDIKGVICQIGILDRQYKQPYLQLNKIYHFTAKIMKIFYQFSSKRKIKCMKYQQTLQILKKSTIPIYSIKKQTQQDKFQSEYCILIPDLIYYLYRYYINTSFKGQNNNQQIPVLSDQIQTNKQNLKKAHFNIRQYLCYIKIKNRLNKIIKNLKKKQKSHVKQIKQQIKTK